MSYDTFDTIFEKPAVVIDMGGHTVKAGFTCDNHPVSMFRNFVARPKDITGLYGRYDYEVPIGDAAVLKGEDMNLSSPIINGRIVQWDNIERVWHHIFYRELKVAPEDRAVIISCSSVMPIAEKIRCTEVFFEVLNSPMMCIQPGSVLSLYGSGLTTGCTVDLGYDTFDVNPAFSGGLIKYAHMRTGFAGRQMCNYITDCLAERDISFGYNTPYIVDDIIKNNVYITPDSAMSRQGYQRYFKSPSGEDIDISNESFMAGEMIFQPDLVTGEPVKFSSLTNAVVSSIMKCDTELRAEIYTGIVMAGGLSMIPGVADRLQKEVSKALDANVNVITSPESDVLAWMGGACFGSIPEARRMWITRRQYDEHGHKIIRNRFI